MRVKGARAQGRSGHHLTKYNAPKGIPRQGFGDGGQVRNEKRDILALLRGTAEWPATANRTSWCACRQLRSRFRARSCRPGRKRTLSVVNSCRNYQFVRPRRMPLLSRRATMRRNTESHHQQGEESPFVSAWRCRRGPVVLFSVL